MEKSIFITGASGVGKSTTLLELSRHGYKVSPNHITRPRRKNEVNGIDAWFIDEVQFLDNLRAGLYFERTAEEAFYGSAFYGSPVCWEEDINLGASTFVAIPSNVQILAKLCQRLTEKGKREGAVWVNLFAPLNTRRERIKDRVENAAMLRHRLYSGISHGEHDEADINIDTSLLSVTQVVKSILALTDK